MLLVVRGLRAATVFAHFEPARRVSTAVLVAAPPQRVQQCFVSAFAIAVHAQHRHAVELDGAFVTAFFKEAETRRVDGSKFSSSNTDRGILKQEHSEKVENA